MQWTSTKAFDDTPVIPISDANLAKYRIMSADIQNVPGWYMAAIIMRLDNAESRIKELEAALLRKE